MNTVLANMEHGGTIYDFPIYASYQWLITALSQRAWVAGALGLSSYLEVCEKTISPDALYWYETGWGSLK